MAEQKIVNQDNQDNQYKQDKQDEQDKQDKQYEQDKSKIPINKVDDIEYDIIDENSTNLNNFKSDTLSIKKTNTLNRLTKYEKVRIIGTRAAQIKNGMPPVFIKDGKHVEIPDEFKGIIKNSVNLAKLELKLKSSPMIIKRITPSGKVNEKTIQELD